MLPRVPFVQRPKMTEDDRTFVKGYVRQGFVLAFIGWIFIAVFFVVAHLGYLDIKTDAPLDTPTDRLIFAARHQSITLAIILSCIYLVIGYRLGTPAMDPTHPQWESTTLKAKNVLTNNVEHGLIMMGTTLLTAIDLSPEQCAHYIPIMTWGYFIARMLFFFGYPHKRNTGVMLSNFIMFPSVCFNVYKLFCMYMKK